jgi:hypothetical protein
MQVIATGQPRAKLDEWGDTIELRVPTGNRERLIIDLTPNQAMALQHFLEREMCAFWKAQKAAKDWRTENVIAFVRQ